MMQNLALIQNTGSWQLTDDDKLRIGIAWDALSQTQDRHINLYGDNLINSYLLKARLGYGNGTLGFFKI